MIIPLGCVARQLRDNLFVMLTCLEIVGAMRGRAAFHDKITTRLRFFSASNQLDGWSALDMAQVCARRSQTLHLFARVTSRKHTGGFSQPHWEEG